MKSRHIFGIENLDFVFLRRRKCLFWSVWLALCFPISGLHSYDTPTQNYRVRKGDTLYSLARRYGVSVNEVMRVNELEDSKQLKPGMLLNIPAKNFAGQGRQSQESIKSGYSAHVVAQGETFYAIARKYAMSIDELLELNGLSPNTVLKRGQTLVVNAPAQRGQDDKSFARNNVANNSSQQDVARKNYYWPTSGQRETLGNKLEGVRILASNRSLVYAVRDGKVMWQGPYRSYGVVTLVTSHDGYVYLYGGNVHFLVNPGQDVRKGEPLGKVNAGIANQMAGQSPIYQGNNQQLAAAKRYPSQVYFSVFRNGEFVPVQNAPRE